MTNFYLSIVIQSMTAQNLVGQTQKDGWIKKFGEPINWEGQILNWMGQCPADPLVVPPLAYMHPLP